MRKIGVTTRAMGAELRAASLKRADPKTGDLYICGVSFVPITIPDDHDK
jgi:hypothetical protein